MSDSSEDYIDAEDDGEDGSRIGGYHYHHVKIEDSEG